MKLSREVAYVFHLEEWNGKNDPITLTRSDWYVYSRLHGKLKPTPMGGNGQPFIYGAKRVLILDAQFVSGKPAVLRASVTRKVTQGQRDDVTDLGILIATVAGLPASGAVQTADKKPPAKTLYISAACQEGTAELPFTIQVTSNVGKVDETVASPPAAPVAKDDSAPVTKGKGGGDSGSSDSSPTPGTITCSGTVPNSLPCTTTRSYTSKEYSYFDFAGGVAIPGVRDSSYAFAASSSTITTTTTRHTDAYAFLDIFPLGAILLKESPVPHINLGLPVTSQSLHRPYVGLAENVTGWTGLEQRLHLPTSINIFFGVVFMKTQHIVGPVPTTQAAFNSARQNHWVRKPMYGIEIPLSSILGKFSKSGGRSKGGSGRS